MMKVLNNTEEFPKSQHLVLTLGVYDGVHVGHQTILKRIAQIAKDKGGHSALLSFWPHPRLVLQKDSDLKLLTLLDEKNDKLRETGIDYHIIQKFDRDFSRQTSALFVRDTLVNKLGVKTLIVGHDHHFGRNREGDFHQLQALADTYDFEVLQLEAILKKDKPVSSTKIRNALLKGELDYANEGLNENYSLIGEVIKGDRIGRTLGYPTINLKIPEFKLIPKDGVYGVQVEINQKSYHGLMNIGYRPTVKGNERRVEVFLFDFESDVYGSHVKVNLINRLRDEQKFESKIALKNQINKDVQMFKDYLSTQ